MCTDGIIRIYRGVGIDLQKEVHEDMEANFSTYPNQARWGLAHTDTNIDHRRVPNLMVFFSRKGQKLPLSLRAEDYSPGDLVTWDPGGGALIAAGVSVIIGVYARLAAALSAFEIGMFLLLVWVPIVAAGSKDAFQWSETFVSTALTASGWVVADSYRRMPRFAADKR